MHFPDIHTNFWDAVIAVPLTVLLTQFFKLFPIPRKYFPTIATIIGFLISIFISHRHDFIAGLFMGGFYGSAAIGVYSSIKTAWVAYKRKRNKK
jgi:hypothetical protein